MGWLVVIVMAVLLVRSATALTSASFVDRAVGSSTWQGARGRGACRRKTWIVRGDRTRIA
jgi:hypothetical protein